MTSEQLNLIDLRQMEVNFEWLPSLLLLKCTVYAQGSLWWANCCTQKVNILCTSVQCHIASMIFKNGKHNTVLCMQLFSVCRYGITNENNI